MDDEPTEIGESLWNEDEILPEEDYLTGTGLEDEDPFDDEPTVTGLNQDTFEVSKVSSRVVLDPRSHGTDRLRLGAATHEATQGGWRERTFVPRGVVPREQLLLGMQQAVQIAAGQKGKLLRIRIALRAELMPLLRQAVEQAGGDGLDAWLQKLTAPTGPPAKDPFLGQLALHMQRFNAALTQPALMEEVKALTALVKKALYSPTPKRLSLRILEQEFEGRIEVDALLAILFSADGELPQRLEQLDRTLDSMRQQLRGLPGASPQGLMWNFSRLKIEKRILEAELVRRGRRA